MGEYLNEMLAVVSLVVPIAYLRRLYNLNFWENSPLFCVQTWACASVSGYCAYVLWDYGILPMPIMSSLLCGIIYFTSQRAYERETTPGLFDRRAHGHSMSRI